MTLDEFLFIRVWTRLAALPARKIRSKTEAGGEGRVRNGTKIVEGNGIQRETGNNGLAAVSYEFFREFIQRCNDGMRNDVPSMNALG